MRIPEIRVRSERLAMASNPPSVPRQAEESAFPSLAYRGSRLVETNIAIFFLVFFLFSLFDAPGSGLIRWLASGALGFNGFYFLRRAIDPKPRLVLDETGIWDRTSVSGSELLIPWSEVVSVLPTFGQKLVEVEVRDLDHLRKNAGRIRSASLALRRMRGKRTVPVFLGYLGSSKDDLTEALENGLIAFERAQLGFSGGPAELASRSGDQDEGGGTRMGP